MNAVIINELDDLIKILKLYPNGANIDSIKKNLKYQIPNRTLQRRLKTLVQNQKIITKGSTKNKIYLLQTTEEISLSKGAQIKLCKKSLLIKEQVSKPLNTRKNVTYHPNFLDKYKPNKTFYLPEKTRQYLYKIGSSQDGKYPAGTFAKQIFHRLLIDLSWNSSRLEGNTYSLLETEKLLNQGIINKEKSSKETQMIINHKAAIEFLIEHALNLEINKYIILNIHALLADNLLSDRACGLIRSIPVSIGKSSYTPASIPQIINESFDKFIKLANAIKDPFEKAFFIMVHLPYLQPFEDVNKRTSRLAANASLIQNNLCPISFVDVDEKDYVSALLGVYELNQIDLLKDVFVWAYERSCFLYSMTKNILKEPDIFRMQYRNQIILVISAIVKEKMDKTKAISFIRKKAKELASINDYMRFIEIVERELQAIHIGNIARYKIDKKDFEKWIKNWS